MKDLIKALQILYKYTGNIAHPVCCKNGKIEIVGVSYSDVTDKDLNQLNQLGVFWSENNRCFLALS